MNGRRRLKGVLARAGALGSPTGVTVLTYHRVGGGTDDELDIAAHEFVRQLDVLHEDGQDVVALDEALDRLDRGDDAPCVVLTFDDGFADVHRHAMPPLVDRHLPFTLYLAAGLVDGTMTWEGSAAASQGAAALSWSQVGDLVSTGLCTIGNHTWSHARPSDLTPEELDRCSDAVADHVGRRPEHFAYPWGVVVPSVEAAVRRRFRSAATGRLGRNHARTDRHRLRRVPVRRTDPIAFFRAKITGSLAAERAYAGIVRVAKTVAR